LRQNRVRRAASASSVVANPLVFCDRLAIGRPWLGVGIERNGELNAATCPGNRIYRRHALACPTCPPGKRTRRDPHRVLENKSIASVVTFATLVLSAGSTAAQGANSAPDDPSSSAPAAAPAPASPTLMGYAPGQPQSQGPAGYPPPPGQVSAYAYPANASAPGQFTPGQFTPGQFPPGQYTPGQPTRDDAQSPQPSEESDDPSVEVAVTTVFPLYVGGQASLELFGHLLLAADLGGMPAAYGSAINGTIQGFAGYDNGVANLADGSFENALVARIAAGVRPFKDAGFELWGGYTMIDVDGQTSLDEIVAAVDTSDLSSEVTAAANQLGNTPVGVSSTIHAVHVGLAWRWLLVDHLSIRASVGYLQALSSSSSLEISELPEVEPLVNPAVDSTLDSLYSDYLKMPYGGLSVGYQF